MNREKWETFNQTIKTRWINCDYLFQPRIQINLKREYHHFPIYTIRWKGNFKEHRPVYNCWKKLGFLFRPVLSFIKHCTKPKYNWKWNTAPMLGTLSSTNSVRNRAIRLTDDPKITTNRAPLSHHHALSDLSIFNIVSCICSEISFRTSDL